jgi:UDP-N-acetylmuramate dehydrogenase
MIRIEENISLKNLNSFGINAMARFRVIFTDVSDLDGISKSGELKDLPLLITGAGTNLLFTGDFQGCLIAPEIPGIRIITDSNDEVIVEAGAGVEWDRLVEWTVNNNLYGIENLSLIPGNSGAALVQNIGAYGAELGRLVKEAEVYDLKNGEFFTLSGDQCRFSYRNSIFKEKGKDRWIVTRIRIKLTRKPSYNLNYGNLSSEVMLAGGTSLINVRKSVIKIRESKLPDYRITGNAGSFFKNPIVDIETLDLLRGDHDQIPVYPAETDGFYKIPAAWMIEKAGWKGYRKGDAGVCDKHALVIVNHGSASGRELYDLAMDINRSVQETFGVMLEPEVRIIGV